MPLPPIPPIDIPGGSTAPDLQTTTNALINQRVTSGESIPQGMKLITEDLSEVVVDTPANTKGMISGGAVTRTGALNYSIAIGSYQVAGKVLSIAAPTPLVCGAPDATNPRFDLIVGDDAGTLSVVPGTPSATPVYPTIAADQAILYVVGVPSAVSSYVDSVIVSQNVDTATIPAVSVNPQGQVSIGGGVIKPTVATYAAAGAVDITKSHHLLNSSGGGFAVTLPLEANAAEIEGITYNFFDSGSAAANNWTVRNMAGVVLATATTNNQVIRVTFIGTTYKIG